MKGILDYSIREGWFVRVKMNQDPISKIIEHKSFNIWSDNVPDYNSSFIDKEVEVRLALINSMGREVDPLDLQKNLSGCDWFAIIENESEILNQYPSDEEIEEISEKLWNEYKDSLQDSQYMARLTFKKREEDFKSGIRYFIKNK